jgi:hypothetical protein
LPMFGSVAADGSEPLLPLSLLGGAGNGAEGQPLVGMGLLGGSRLTLDAEPGGEVLVEDLAEERA